MPSRRVIILGSTGSIGRQTLDVIAHLNALHTRGEHAHHYDVVGLAAGANVARLEEQSRVHPSARLAITNAHKRDLALGEQGPKAAFTTTPHRAFHGEDAAERLVREVECDLVVSAIVGVAGLRATLAAAELGRDIALANKETLVAGGCVVVPAARTSGARLLPVDSEHSGLWQCLVGACATRGGMIAPPMEPPPGITRMILTASGGPFRTWTKSAIDAATPAQALAHPTWQMGAKVTIDSASLVNKALELIEAHWLFGMPADRLDAVVHPQSVVHALVEFDDGSTLAQLGSPDMRTPIQWALTFPGRAEAPTTRLRWHEARHLDFEPVDRVRFPAIDLAFEAMHQGPASAMGCVLNAANEVAVQAFLAPGSTLAFGKIGTIVRRTIDELGRREACTLDDVLRVDREVRAFALDLVMQESRGKPLSRGVRA